MKLKRNISSLYFGVIKPLDLQMRTEDLATRLQILGYIDYDQENDNYITLKKFRADGQLRREILGELKCLTE